MIGRKRTAEVAAAIAIGRLALLGGLVGWAGASRAYSVGVHTLYRDQLPAMIVVLLGSAIAGLWLGRRADSLREVATAIGVVIVLDVVAALAITVMINEMRRYPDLVRAFLAETAGGALVIAVMVGAVVGYLDRSRHPR